MATDPTRQSGSEDERARLRARDEKRAKWIFGLWGLLLLLFSWVRGRRQTRPPGSEANKGSAASAPKTEPNKGHETRDANAKWIFGVVLFLLCFGLSLHGILAGFLGSLKAMPPPADAWRPAQPARPNPATTPGPMLQLSPSADMRAFREREELELHTYGWINRSSGVVRVPIERAIELVLQEGLPARSSTNRAKAGPSTYQLIRQRPEHRENEIQGDK